VRSDGHDAQAVKNLVYLALPMYQRDLAAGRVPSTAANPASAGNSEGAAQPANGRPGRNGNQTISLELRHAADDEAASGLETDSDDEDTGTAGRAGAGDGPRDGGVTLHGVVRRTAKLADDRRAPGAQRSTPETAHGVLMHSD